MTAMQVDGDFIADEPGQFDEHGMALSFFYYRNCDRASDYFLDEVGIGAEARRSINRSTYSATATLDVVEPVTRGTPLRFEITVSRIGGKSVGYRVTMLGAKDDRVRAIYDTVGVCMDMTGPTPMAIPDEVREKLSAFA